MMQDASIVISNPFAALAAVAGPAVLTNACSVLALGTSNRLGRVVDRRRVVVREASALPSDDTDRSEHIRQLESLDTRAEMLLKALRSFYASLGLFATAALLSAVGSVLASYDQAIAFRLVALAALASGTFAVVGMVFGCSQMVRETSLAVQGLAHEARLRTF